ncbi:MAG: hypothetical protein MN733_15875 [Nitrososphaera sp.]|nr:hypothetical protein [Nitrososphaera sp.]
MRWKEETGKYRRGRNWMSAMGVLFMVSAAIILIRNLVLYNIDFSAGVIENPTRQFLDSFVNAQITNEKFALAMVAAGGFLLYWGFFRKKDDFGPPDESDWRRSYR